MNEDQRKELYALVIWLQSFESFPHRICQSSDYSEASEAVYQQLSSMDITRSILKIAESLLVEEGVLPKESQISDKTTSEQLWTSILMATSTRARPLQREIKRDENMSPPRLKLYVLSNLLDLAVQCPNKHQRREYIERIMKLNKSVQKVLMSLIERRNRRSPKKQTPSPHRPGNGRSPVSSRETPQPQPRTPPKDSTSKSPERSPNRSPVRSLGIVSGTPPRSSLRKSSPGAASNGSSPGSTTPKKKVAWSDRPMDDSVSTPLVHTPELSKPKTTKSFQDSILSPGTLESPNQVQTIVRDMYGRNRQLEKTVEILRKREGELKVQVEKLEGETRKHMMQVESKAMDREQEIVQQYKQTMENLENKLKECQERAEKGEKALQELQQAKEDIEVMNHNKSLLSETNEKLRVFKTKVNELQDVKEALEREQEAHGKSVDEIVRLENELQSLLPVKRQVEEYKTRAVEAEVKLVECQDYLQRIEREASSKNIATEHLFKEAAMHKEQVEELQRRIQAETESSGASDINGVGDGISELNPELNEELKRLRNENLKLRAFAGKREDDAVQRMEEALDDAKRLSERYKSEYLGARSSLDDTKNELTVALKREEALVAETKDLHLRMERAEENIEMLEDKLSHTTRDLDRTRSSLSDYKQRLKDAGTEVEEWKEKFNQSEVAVMKLNIQASQLKSDLKECEQALENANESIEDLEEHNISYENQVEEMRVEQEELESKLKEMEDALESTTRALHAAKTEAASSERKIESLNQRISELMEDLENESFSKQEQIEEHQKTLEATRQVLEAKAKKDMLALKEDMDMLLEKEREAARLQQAQGETMLYDTQQNLKRELEELQNRMASSLKHSRAEAQERLDLMKKEHEEELVRVKTDAAAARSQLIHKGKALLAESTDKCKREMEKMALDQTALEQKVEVAETQAREVEKLLKSKISSQRQKNEHVVRENNKLAEENAELQDEVYQLQREVSKLQEENDDCRQQLEGRYGADGQLQSQLEKLQKEYNAVLEENRSLKKKGRYGGTQMLGSISEQLTEDDTIHEGSYSRGGISREAMTEFREGYETIIENLRDEKRELVMKNSAAATDVKKAEQRVWDAEKQISALNDKILSLELQLQRNELRNDEAFQSNFPDSSRSLREMSFFSAREEADRSPQPTDKSPSHRRSPNIERAMREKQQHESALVSMVQHITGSPTKSLPVGSQIPGDCCGEILSPSHKYQQQNNKMGAQMASDVFGLGTVKQEPLEKSDDGKAILNFPLPNTSDSLSESMDGKPECQQS